MKNRYPLLSGILLALALALGTMALAEASAVKRSPQVTKPVLAAPVLPNDYAKPHSDAWTDSYLDKYAASSYVIHVKGDFQEPLRGGLAELHASQVKPVGSKSGLAPHSDAWNAFYLDRSINTHWSLTAGLSTIELQAGAGIPNRNTALNRWDLLP